MLDLIPCPSCRRLTPRLDLSEAHNHAFWRKPDGACPACVQQALLNTLLTRGDRALHEQIQSVWPLDAEVAFGALPTPLRLHADPRFAGRGITMAIIDSGFYPHPDLTQPHNRIRAWVDATTDPMSIIRFGPDDLPQWPGWDAGTNQQWHGTMTAAVAAGNGYLSHGLYRGLAGEAQLVLVQVRDERGIRPPVILRALNWVIAHQAEFAIRVVNLSFGGERVAELKGNLLDRAIAELVSGNVIVTVAAGNDGLRHLNPPATAPEALTIGGLDDHNTFDHDEVSLWHSNYGPGADKALKPELVAPSIWVAAPVLPGTSVAHEAAGLFRRRGNETTESRIAELKLITPHYQHVDGTSFAAPLVSGAVACMLEANPGLSPAQVRHILQQTAIPVSNVSRERQGAGALAAGAAVSLALHERHSPTTVFSALPSVINGDITFTLLDDTIRQARVLGSWDGWKVPGLKMMQIEPGVWHAGGISLAGGDYGYKFLLDDDRWLDDPANPHKAWDGFGGFNSVLRVPVTPATKYTTLNSS